MKKNKRERDEDSMRHGDQYDTHLLWFLMRHMRNRRPQRVSAPTEYRKITWLCVCACVFLFLIFFQFTVEQMSTQTHREGGEQDTDESWSSPDSSDEDDGGPDHVQCMSS